MDPPDHLKKSLNRVSNPEGVDADAGLPTKTKPDHVGEARLCFGPPRCQWRQAQTQMVTKVARESKPASGHGGRALTLAPWQASGWIAVARLANASLFATACPSHKRRASGRIACGLRCIISCA